VDRLVADHADAIRAHPYAPGDFAPTTDSGRRLRQLSHRAVMAVTRDASESFHFNTAISALMEFTNGFPGLMDAKTEPAARAFALKRLIVLAAPFAPHLAEEWWERSGEKPSVFEVPWPSFDPAAAAEDVVEIPVQVNGKHRATVQAPKGAGEEALKALVLQDAKIKALTEGKTVRRWVIVSGRLVNLVVG